MQIFISTSIGLLSFTLLEIVHRMVLTGVMNKLLWNEVNQFSGIVKKGDEQARGNPKQGFLYVLCYLSNI